MVYYGQTECMLCPINCGVSRATAGGKLNIFMAIMLRH